MSDLLEQVRVSIPEDEIEQRGKAELFFEVLPNSQGLTEEYLYTHQPRTDATIPVYSTSDAPIGRLDDCAETRRAFAVLEGPVIVVARKGYAGRLYVVNDPGLIVHEDAYAIRPRPEYDESINLSWFAGHYSTEFQQSRTSFWGIGDFPRVRFNGMEVVIPRRDFQQRIAALYVRRAAVLKQLDTLRQRISSLIDDRVQSRLL